MALLTSAQRRKLPADAFALPGRRFPIHDLNHAKDALARAHYATPAEQATIKAKVHARYPGIKINGKG